MRPAQAIEPDRPSRGTAAGVPFVAIPPPQGGPGAAVVVAWHSMDPPSSAHSMAAVLPLDGLDAWRIYLALPGQGSRAAAGAEHATAGRRPDELLVSVPGPVVENAAAEFPAVLGELADRLPVDDVPIGLLGCGVGASVVQLILGESAIPVRAAVLIDPAVGPGGVGAGGRCPSDVAEAILNRRPGSDVMVVTGPDDDPGTRARAEQLWYLLSSHHDSADSASLVTVPDLRLILARQQGAALRTIRAAPVDDAVVGWFRRRLTRTQSGSTAPGDTAPIWEER